MRFQHTHTLTHSLSVVFATATHLFQLLYEGVMLCRRAHGIFPHMLQAVLESVHFVFELRASIFPFEQLFCQEPIRARRYCGRRT